MIGQAITGSVGRLPASTWAGASHILLLSPYGYTVYKGS